MGNTCAKEPSSSRPSSSKRYQDADFDDIETAGRHTSHASEIDAVAPTVGSSRAVEANTTCHSIDPSVCGAVGPAPVPRSLVVSQNEQQYEMRDFDAEDMADATHMITSPSIDTVAAPRNILSGSSSRRISFTDIDENAAIDKHDEQLGQQTLMHLWLDDQVNVRLKKAVMTPQECDEARSAAKRNVRILACSERVVPVVGPTSPTAEGAPLPLPTTRRQISVATAVVAKPGDQHKSADRPHSSVLDMVKRAAGRRPM